MPRNRRVTVSQHREEIPQRLHKIEGQIAGIRKMYEDGRNCVEVLDQISAARAGLRAAGLAVLDEHIDGCMREAVGQAAESDATKAAVLEAVHRWVRSV